MKATGEVMAIGQSFEEALMKAVRGAEIKHTSLNQPSLYTLSDDELISMMRECTDERLFVIYELLKRGKEYRIYPRRNKDRYVLPRKAHKHS